MRGRRGANEHKLASMELIKEDIFVSVEPIMDDIFVIPSLANIHYVISNVKAETETFRTMLMATNHIQSHMCKAAR